LVENPCQFTSSHLSNKDYRDWAIHQKKIRAIDLKISIKTFSLMKLLKKNSSKTIQSISIKSNFPSRDLIILKSLHCL